MIQGKSLQGKSLQENQNLKYLAIVQSSVSFYEGLHKASQNSLQKVRTSLLMSRTGQERMQYCGDFSEYHGKKKVSIFFCLLNQREADLINV